MAKVMLVDNATFVRSTLKAYLDESEHEVVSEASNGEDALSMLKVSDNPDVIVMNVSLPGMDGLEVTRRALKIDPSLTVILCSIRDQSDDVKRAFLAGAVGFLVKPFTRDTMLHEIRRALTHTT